MEMENRPNLRWIGLASLVGLAVLLAALDLFAKPRAPFAGLRAPSATSSAILASSSQARITWSQTRVDLALSLGERTARSLTFTSSKALQNVVLDVVPEIAPFLSVVPTAFATVPAGQAQAVLLSFSAPVTPAALGEYEGTVHLRQGNRTIPQTLKVSLTIFDDAVPPPDPGEAGKATLAGIDSDEDGVRDDVQRYIALTFPDSQKTRAALRQLARVLQVSLLDADNSDASINHTVQFFHAKECLSVFRSFEDRRAIGGELLARFLDTPDRSLAWVDSGKHFSGHTYSSTPPAERAGLCDFDLVAMEN